MKRIAGNHLLVVALLLVIADNVGMVRVAFGPVLGRQTSTVMVVLAWLWLGLVAATVAVLLRRPRRALFLVVPLVLFSTVGLSISMVPFVQDIVPATLRPYTMSVWNALFIVASVFLVRPGTEISV